MQSRCLAILPGPECMRSRAVMMRRGEEWINNSRPLDGKIPRKNERSRRKEGTRNRDNEVKASPGEREEGGDERMRKVYVTVRECVSELPALSLSRPSSRHISCPGLLSTDISWYRLLYCLTCLVLKAFFLNCTRTHIYRAPHTHSRTHTRLGIQHCLRDSRATRNQFRTHPTHPHRQLSHSKFTSSGLPPIHTYLPTPHTHTHTSSHLSILPLFSITAEAESRWFQVSASRTGTQRSYGALTFYLPLSPLPSSPHVPTLLLLSLPLHTLAPLAVHRCHSIS